MKDGGISSILVRSLSSSAQNSLITGIVIERDILYRVIGGNKGPYKTMCACVCLMNELSHFNRLAYSLASGKPVQ